MTWCNTYVGIVEVNRNRIANQMTTNSISNTLARGLRYHWVACAQCCFPLFPYVSQKKCHISMPGSWPSPSVFSVCKPGLILLWLAIAPDLTNIQTCKNDQKCLANSFSFDFCWVDVRQPALNNHLNAAQESATFYLNQMSGTVKLNVCTKDKTQQRTSI